MLLAGLMIMAMPQHSKAQNGTGSAYSFPVVAGDSLVTADSVYKKVPITGAFTSLGMQIDIKKATGTLDGKFYVYTSVNGQRYVLTDSASFTTVPTFGAKNANGGYTHTAMILKTAPPPGSAYMMVVTQVGSLTASPTLFSYTARKHGL